MVKNGSLGGAAPNGEGQTTFSPEDQSINSFTPTTTPIMRSHHLQQSNGYSTVNKPKVAMNGTTESLKPAIIHKKRTTFNLHSSDHPSHSNHENGHYQQYFKNYNSESYEDSLVVTNKRLFGDQTVFNSANQHPNQPPPYYHPSHVINHGGGCHDSEVFRRDLNSVHDCVTGDEAASAADDVFYPPNRPLSRHHFQPKAGFIFVQFLCRFQASFRQTWVHS